MRLTATKLLVNSGLPVNSATVCGSCRETLWTPIGRQRLSGPRRADCAVRSVHSANSSGTKYRLWQKVRLLVIPTLGLVLAQPALVNLPFSRISTLDAPGPRAATSLHASEYRIIVYNRDVVRFRELALLLGDGAARSDALEFSLETSGATFRLHHAGRSSELLRRLAGEYVHALVIDLRTACASGEAREAILREGRALLERVDSGSEIEARYGFHRIIVLVSGESDATDDLVAEMGARGVGKVLRQGGEEPDATFGKRLADMLARLVRARRPGKTALCASGGGITGIYFHLGVMKCLDDCLGGRALDAFDLVFGISAGAVVTGILAAGYTTDDFMASIAGHEGGRLSPINLRLLRLSHLNYPDIASRIGLGAFAALRNLGRPCGQRHAPSFDSLLLDYGDLVGAPFHSGEFERVLRRILESSACNNDFRALNGRFFVGASDQDRRRHVLFGADGYKHVPISRAIQASLSVHPAFSSVAIDGRYYEDGAVTRTSEVDEAVSRGATLVFTVDPFVPYVARRPGTVRRRGLLYNLDQDLRTLSFTRFETGRNWMLRKHPEVSSYTFLPSNRLRAVIGVSPMDHRAYLPIWRGGYLSALYRVRNLAHRLNGDLRAHGIALDTSRAEAVAARLEQISRPQFADFFPDGKVELERRAYSPIAAE